MEKRQAYEISCFIDEVISSKKSFYNISKIPLVNGRVYGFNQFINNRDTVGAFKILATKDEIYYLFFVPWNLDEKYYLVLHADGFKEALIGAKDVVGNILQWMYRPTKRDGRNPERKKKFVEEYLDLKVEIRLPRDASEVDDLLSELFKVARARINAESIAK